MMKLIYRGVTYDYNPAPSRAHNAGRPSRSTPAQVPYTLIYRGQTYSIDPNARSTEAPMPAEYDLLYRGTAYQVRRDAEGTTMTARPAGLASGESVPATMPRRYVAKVHQANLLKNLQHRIQVAQARGDEQLMRLLESELRQINP
jgi:hypothetical protein